MGINLGQGHATYVIIGNVFNNGKETAKKASGLVNSLLKVFRVHAVNFLLLDRPDQWDEIEDSFEFQHGIPHIFGEIDGTHVPVEIPANETWKGNFCNLSHICPPFHVNIVLFVRITT
ncbi:hypothetical protein VP01_2371g5 [Puccinia sorghi]|uniref:DDE Tnp4 domain-containing protein n=1 Tax=Puccinia sorghi TaxID=27349 RepID=A0A0L6V736_9BASI|nr:hypothetical protein VP01_2371g5 [Puccinia sorghi]